jgi:hypothetical protein
MERPKTEITEMVPLLSKVKQKDLSTLILLKTTKESIYLYPV